MHTHGNVPSAETGCVGNGNTPKSNVSFTQPTTVTTVHSSLVDSLAQ